MIRMSTPSASKRHAPLVAQVVPAEIDPFELLRVIIIGRSPNGRIANRR